MKNFLSNRLLKFQLSSNHFNRNQWLENNEFFTNSTLEMSIKLFVRHKLEEISTFTVMATNLYGEFLSIIVYICWLVRNDKVFSILHVSISFYPFFSILEIFICEFYGLLIQFFGFMIGSQKDTMAVVRGKFHTQTSCWIKFE